MIKSTMPPQHRTTQFHIVQLALPMSNPFVQVMAEQVCTIICVNTHTNNINVLGLHVGLNPHPGRACNKDIYLNGIQSIQNPHSLVSQVYSKHFVSAPVSLLDFFILLWKVFVNLICPLLFNHFVRDNLTTFFQMFPIGIKCRLLALRICLVILSQRQPKQQQQQQIPS